MRFDTEKIWLNGIQIFPSTIYYATLKELKSFTKENTISNLLGDGAYLGNSKLEPRTFLLYVTTRKRYDVVNDFKIQQILSMSNILLSFKLKGFDKVLETYITTESIANDNFGQLTATVKAYDPYLHIQNSKNTNLKTRRYNKDFNFINNKTFNLTNGFDFKSEIFEGAESEILNECYVDIYPIIDIIGDCSNFSISNKTTGEILKVDYAINDGETLEIDCNPKTRSVYLYNSTGKSTNLITSKSGNFLTLVNGSNIVSCEYDGTADIVVKWKERFI